MKSAPARPGWEFWIDRGGTFTDVIGRAPTAPSRRSSCCRSPTPTRTPRSRPCGGCWASRAGAPFPGRRVARSSSARRSPPTRSWSARARKTLLVTTRGLRRRPGDRRPDAAQPLRPRHRQARAALRRRGRGATSGWTPTGAVLRPLDEAALRRGAGRARRPTGFESVAIAFLHADLNPAHERRAGELARAAGFAFVALSSEVSPLPRFIPRAETTVVDAYLTPVLRAYVAAAGGGGRRRAAVLHDLGRRRWCGRTPSAAATRVVSRPGRRRGRRGADVAEARGGAAVLGFDMGGTSTDVCRYAGALERRDTARVAGVQGCARRCWTWRRWRPAAARSSPSTACAPGSGRPAPAPIRARPAYGRGGPATVTDANLVLGRLDPAPFPGGVRTARRRAARRRPPPAPGWPSWRAAMGAPSAEAAAEGFLAVAVEQMAGAIRRISTERGFDPRGHALVAFGGAAGQVACQVADALGIARGALARATPACSPPGASARRGCARSRQAGLERRAGRRRACRRPTTCAERLAARGARPNSPRRARGRRRRGAGSASATPKPTPPCRSRSATLDAVRARLRGRAPAPVRLHRAGPADPDRQRRGGGSRRIAPSPLRGGASGWAVRNTVERGVLHRRPPAPSRSRGRGSDRARPTPRSGVAPGWRATEEPDGLIRLVRDATPARAAASAADEPRSGHPRAVQPPLHGRRRGDGRGAGADGALGEHQGAAGLLLRPVRRRRRPGRQRAAHAGAPGLDGRQRAGGARAPPDARARRGLRAQQPLRRRHPPAGHHRGHAGVRREAEPAPAFFVAARGHHADVGGVQPGSMPPFSHTIDEEGVLLDALPIMRGGVFLEAETRAALTAGPVAGPRAGPQRRRPEGADRRLPGRRGGGRAR